MPRRRIQWDDRVVFRVADLFLKGDSATSISETVNRDRDLAPLLPTRVTRENVYVILQVARERKMILLIPPPEGKLKGALCERFNLDLDSVSVVDTHSKGQSYRVSLEAAQIAVRRIVDVSKRKEVIGLGLGPGRGTLDFCTYFADFAQNAEIVPTLKLFAIGAGCPVKHPEYAPPSFFNLFPNRLLPHDSDERRVGLFVEPMVSVRQFRDVMRMETSGPFREAFNRRDEIDVVINSMGSHDDVHDLYQLFYKDYGSSPPQGYLGNVQYRPFNADGPIIENEDSLRPATLFELDDFREMFVTRKDKYAILIARQCAMCGKTRAKALLPLLELPALRVWTDLVLDVATCDEVLAMRPNSQVPSPVSDANSN